MSQKIWSTPQKRRIGRVSGNKTFFFTIYMYIYKHLPEVLYIDDKRRGQCQTKVTIKTENSKNWDILNLCCIILKFT